MSSFCLGGGSGSGQQSGSQQQQQQQQEFQQQVPDYGRGPVAPPPSPAKPSWSELKTHVRTTRRDLSSLSARVPTLFSFRTMPTDPNHTRLYFLAALQMGRETSLFYIDVKSDEASVSSSGAPSSSSQQPPGPAMPSLVWNPLIETSFQLGRVSREEELQLERKRCAAFGITNYELDPKSGAFVFPAAGSLFSCVDDASSNRKMYNFDVAAPLTPTPIEIKTGLENARLNPTICPTNPDLIAFACNGDIWVTSMKTGQEVQLTEYHGGKPISEDPLSAGLPSYVTQEEFSRFNSFWWRPVQPVGGEPGGVRKYTLLFEVVDDTNVDVLRFPVAGSTDVEEFRFPKAGSNNSVSHLRIVQFGVSPATGAIVDVETFNFNLHKYFPWLEYLVRVGWTPDGKYVWVQLLDRPQQHMDLVLIPVQSFALELDHEPLHPDSHLQRQAGIVGSHGQQMAPPPLQVIYRSTSEAWINVSDILTFCTPTSDPASAAGEASSNYPSSTVSTEPFGASQNPNEVSDTITFIISSECTSWKHLYQVTSKIYPKGSINHLNEKEFFDAFLTPHVVSKTALTQGQWCVHDKIWFDEKNRFVYFHGYREDPLENHLYVVSLDQPLNVVRLTELGCSHSVQINQECNLLVTVFSSVHNPPSCCVFRIRNTNGTAEGVALTPVGCLHEAKAPDHNYKYPELFSYKISSGDKLCGMMFKPHRMVEGRKYPVVLCVYGGPEVQLVTNTFKGMRQMRSHLLAQEGYYVVSIDSRGSCNRGLAFEAHLRFRMGQVELQDQVEVLRWLGSNTPSMDLDRVAIHGWSYGGYLSLIGLVSYPDLFKVSVAGAPVTSWMHYDTGYTERYMGLPSNNSWGYNLGSVVARASEFPDEPNRLLIIHGLMDENVHFYQHTAPLLQSLVKHGKPYQLQIYPNERHSLRRLDASEQYETTLLFFLQSNL